MIGFLYPWALAGLTLIAVPFLLHLLARRDPPTRIFPALRYLLEATQEREQRRKLQHWLLLLVRTLLVAALVLAAAGPSLARRGLPGHAPAALVLVLDNSASSGAIADGTRRLDGLKEAARAALGRATPDDALWLLPADGVPRRGTAAELRARLDSLGPSADRLDLGEAVRTADEVLAGERRPGEILVLTDAQRTAFSAARPVVPVTVARPTGSAPNNLGLASVQPTPQPWGADGGRVTVELAGDSARGTQVQLIAGTRPARSAFAQAGAPVTLNVVSLGAGWQPLQVALDADELRADDVVATAVRVAPPARADCAAAGRWVRAACDVLRQNGRLAPGAEVRFGEPGIGLAIVEPPADAARLGAVNRALAQRGVPWQFGLLAPAGTVDSGGPAAGARVQRRLALVSAGSGRTGVLATVGGAPWLVAADGIVLVGSRLEPEWTDLPLNASFVPFVDGVLNRAVRGVVPPLTGAPGLPVPLPDRVTAVVGASRRWDVEPGAPFRAPEPGRFYLLAGRDTIGVLAAQVDARESRLAPATADEIAALWPGTRTVRLDEAGDAAFSSAARADLRGPLLWLALGLGLVELLLASARRRTAA